MTLNLYPDILFIYLFIMSDTAVTTIDESMLTRWAWQTSTSVMDNIHKLKIYNANPFSKDPKEKEIDPDKVGKFRLVESSTWAIKFIDGWFKADILSVCKVKSGSVFILNEFGETIKDDKWQSKKGFFMTNEHSVYTKKTDTLWFKQLGLKVLWFYPKAELEEMLKTKKIDWKDNPFWKQGKKLDWEPYNDTSIKDTMIVYGKFIDWPYEWEYFKFVPVSNSAYWSTYKNGNKVDAEAWTFLHAMELWLQAWNKVKVANWQKAVTSVDPSQIDMRISFREVEVQKKRMFLPVFEFDNLTAYRANNTSSLQYVLELQSEYLEEEFWIKIIPENFRLPSLKSETSNPLQLAAAATIISDTDDWIEVVDAIDIFDDTTPVSVKKDMPFTWARDWWVYVQWEKVPF